ncbi:hypothetical protein [Nonomuraea sp. NPDC049684]|uniref:hypothetical protein n=1 Tax=unclassified Nonomuraea TaxID=2593643 RepID=UPI0037B7396F
MTFSVPIAVRGYELDTRGHLDNVVYHQYGDHARWECLRAAGVGVRQEFRGADGEPAAELTGVGGLMDLRARRLLPDPGRHWRALARTPAVPGP